MPSWPGLTRPSIPSRDARRSMDARVKPAHDEDGNPFDSAPILIRLPAVPSFNHPARLCAPAKLHLVRNQHESRDMLRERNGTQRGVSDSAAIRSRVVPKLKANGKSVAK
nr:hypothetical protein BDOA9_0115230 [Bradyrhizobium sp. DOA9]